MTHYRTTAISIFALLLLTGARTVVADELSIDDAKSVAAYPLTMDKVERKFAAAADLSRLSVTDAAFQGQMQGISQAKSLDAQINALSAVPKAAAVLRSHGITARDYSLTTLAVNFAQLPQMPTQGRPANLPLTPREVAAPPEHVEFVRAHIEEIHKLTAAIMQARKDAQH